MHTKQYKMRLEETLTKLWTNTAQQTTNIHIQAKSANRALWSPQIFIVRSQRSPRLCWNERSYCSLCSDSLTACLSLPRPDVRATSQQLRQEISPQAVKGLILVHKGRREENKTCTEKRDYTFFNHVTRFILILFFFAMHSNLLLYRRKLCFWRSAKWHQLLLQTTLVLVLYL